MASVTPPHVRCKPSARVSRIMAFMPLLHDRFPELRRSLPYLELGSSPTPVRRLDLGSVGHAAVWLKDDSRYGNGGWGGNKVRKLEWLIPDAQRRGKGTILTFGGL